MVIAYWAAFWLPKQLSF